MNYRHVFHAGKFADCVKLDTHAGRYDLLAEAERTGEWRDGIVLAAGGTIRDAPTAPKCSSPTPRAFDQVARAA